MEVQVQIPEPCAQAGFISKRRSFFFFSSRFFLSRSHPNIQSKQARFPTETLTAASPPAYALKPSFRISRPGAHAATHTSTQQ